MERLATAGEPPGGDPTDRRWLGGLVLSALVLRLAHVLTIRDTPYFEYLMLDPRMYDEWAQTIAGGAWLGERPFFQDPLYPYWLATIYRVLGHHYTPVVLLQAVCGALVPGFVYLAAARWFARPAAAAAGIAAVLYLPSIYYEGLILKTWLATALVAAFLAVLAAARIGGSVRTWAAAGLLLGLAVLTRGNLLLVIPVVAAWTMLDAPSEGTQPAGRRARLRDRTAWIATAVLVGAGLLPVGATAIRNRAVGGEWILTTSNAGQNFYIGNNAANEKGQYTRLPFVDPNPRHEERGFAREAERRAGRALTPAEVSRFWFGEAGAWIRAQPADAVALTWKKFRNYWGAYEVPDNLDYYLYRESAPVLRLPLPGFGLVAPLGLLGAMLALGRRGWPRLLVLFVGTYSISVVLFFVFSRFRMPMMPALFALAGFAVCELVHRASTARSRGWAPLLRAGVPFLVLFAFVNLPVRGPVDSVFVRLAGRAGLPVRVETSASGHFNLGVAYAARAKEADDPSRFLALAEAELRAALEQEYRFAETWVELGKVLARQGRNSEALDMYRRAAEIEPADPRNHHAQGLLLRRLDDPAGAERAFRQALMLAPAHVASSNELGRLLLESGRAADARRAFAHTLRFRPDDAAARRGLEQAGDGP